MWSFILFLFLFLAGIGSLYAQKDRILVFSKTAGFRHDSAIAEGQRLLFKLGKKLGVQVDTTENESFFEKESLERYSALVFLCTSGQIFNEKQKEAFQNYMEKGGGFMGIHSASTTEYDWAWYGNLVGAYFQNHPPGKVDAKVYRVNKMHPATASLPNPWEVNDEIYNFKWMSTHLNVVLVVDEKSFKGGTHGAYHPISWYQEFSGGKSFYTALGHDEEVYKNELFIRHILGGLSYVLGRD